MTRTRALILLGVVALALAAAFRYRSTPRATGRLSPPLERGSITESIYGIGTVTANKRFQLRTGTITTISNLFVREGERVARGQNLVELEQGVMIAAPFEGTITWVPAKVGENVFPQTIVLELVDLADRYVTVSLEQRAAVRVRSGQQATLSFEELRDKAFDGTVQSVYSREGSFLVRVDAPALPPEILPGMTADVAISISVRHEALLIPVAAIDDGRVVVKRGARPPAETAIEIGLVDGAIAEVASGDVQPGDRLILPADGG
jgi:multidrug efflux pump subunit AcrA (membrane-fusion protein)